MAPEVGPIGLQGVPPPDAGPDAGAPTRAPPTPLDAGAPTRRLERAPRRGRPDAGAPTRAPDPTVPTCRRWAIRASRTWRSCTPSTGSRCRASRAASRVRQRPSWPGGTTSTGSRSASAPGTSSGPSQDIVQRDVTTPDCRTAARATWTNAIIAAPVQAILIAVGTALFL